MANTVNLLAITFCTFFEGVLYSVPGEDGYLVCFNTYFLARGADGKDYILNSHFIPGHYCAEPDGWNVPNRNYKTEAAEFAAKVEKRGRINLAYWSEYVEQRPSWGTAEDDRMEA